MNNKNLVSDCPGGGGTVTLSGPWTMCSDNRILEKKRLLGFSLLK